MTEPGTATAELRKGSARVWLAALRPRTLGASAAPVLVGTALAASIQGMVPWAALAALLGAVGLQVGANLVNDWGDDRRGADDEGRLGPPRMVQAGLLTPRQVLAAAVGAFALAAAAGLYLIGLAGWPVAAIGVAGILSAVAYTAGPFPLAYLGLGDLFVFTFFGPVAVAGTCWVQAGTLPPAVIPASIGVGLVVTNILVVNNLRDRRTDAAVAKRTLVVRFGPRAARIQYLLAMSAAFLLPVAWVLAGAAPPKWLVVLGALPIGLFELRGVWRREGRDLNRHLRGSAELALVYGILLAAGVGPSLCGWSGACR